MKITAVTQTALAGALLLAVPYAAQAQIMKCVGKDGRIEFASTCPPGTKQSDTGVSNKPAAAAPAAKGDKGAPKSLAEREAEFRKRQTEQKDTATKAEQTAQDNADRKRACEAAQSNVQALKAKQRMFRIDPKTGERTVYDDADSARELPVAERLAAENCK